MEIPLLKDVVIIFGLSIGVLLLFHRLHIPSIVGFLITGVLAGPHGLKLISAVEEVRILAEIGIIVLLFTVGLEFSLSKIWEYKRYFLIAGPIQVFLTTVGGFIAGLIIGRPLGEAIFLGFLVSLSSTAIVIRILQERAETNSSHGRLITGVLIFQDVIVVPMMLVTPLLSGADSEFDASLIYLLAKGLLILVVTFVSAIQLVPTLLFYVAKTRSRELFLLTVLVICFSVAWVTSSIGLSLALGAFLAGLIISESEYSFQAIGDVLPFQDIFTSFFFVSIGMLLDIDFFLEHPFPIIFISVAIFLLKSLVVSFSATSLGMPIRQAVLSGIALSQVGEFSFVLAMSGISYGIGTDYLHQLFLAVAVLTMGVTPTLIAVSPKIANYFLQLPLPDKLKTGLKFLEPVPKPESKGHVIIIGYGFSGRNLARSSREANVPYVIIDMNPETVREEKLKGEPIYFGDATREWVLKHANIQHAKAVAILVNDPIASLRIVEHARRLNPSVYLVVRTRYLEEMQALFQLGADDVIPDELGSSVEIFSRVLMKYDVPFEKIEQLVSALRSEGYELLRSRLSESTIFSDLKEHLADVGVKTFVVGQDTPFLGKNLEELQLRNKYNVTVLMIKRKNETIYHVTGKSVLLPRDKVVLIGTKEHLETAGDIISH